MLAIQRTRSTSLFPCLFAAVALVVTAGCGFCVVEFTCPAGNCCREFRCYEVKDCPPAEMKAVHADALANAEQCGDEIDPSTD